MRIQHKALCSFREEKLLGNYNFQTLSQAPGQRSLEWCLFSLRLQSSREDRHWNIIIPVIKALVKY